MARHNVPPFSQQTLNMCWEACARMMWHWRYRINRALREQYAARAGHYAHLNRGLSEAEMNTFYTRLGMRSLGNPRGANIRHALGWSPVIITSTDQVAGHAMVVAGFAGGNYAVINPCGIQVVSFGEGDDSCTVNTVPRTTRQVEDRLGSYIWYW